MGLIAPGVILTAAHCAAKFQQEPTKLKIRCGEWDTQNQTEPRPHQDRYVQNLDIHPEFNPRNLANDWAVLYTSQDFDLQAHIDTICLPQPEELFNGQTCFATGWGKDQFGAAGNYQVVLKEIDLPVVGHDQCEASLRTTRLGIGSSWTIRLSALAELTARTPAREMVEAPLSARASLTQLPTSRLVSLPGVSAVARTTRLVSMPPCPRVSAGLTTP